MSDLHLSKLADDYKKLSWKPLLTPGYTPKHFYRFIAWAMFFISMADN